MLTSRFQSQPHGLTIAGKQKGVVLLLTLIMLVAMTLAAIAMMRSVDTTNLISGNLAFQQSSIHVADVGTEAAISYLYTVPNVQCLGTGVGAGCPVGYKSFHEPLLEPPTAGKTWDSFWNAMVATTGAVNLTTLPADYTGAFVIEALCDTAGQVNCTLATISSTSSTTTPQGQDMGSTVVPYSTNTTNTTTTAHYYRITTRIVGPRNSVGYVQTIIAL